MIILSTLLKNMKLTDSPPVQVYTNKIKKHDCYENKDRL